MHPIILFIYIYIHRSLYAGCSQSFGGRSTRRPPCAEASGGVHGGCHRCRIGDGIYFERVVPRFNSGGPGLTETGVIDGGIAAGLLLPVLGGPGFCSVDTVLSFVLGGPGFVETGVIPGGIVAGLLLPGGPGFCSADTVLLFVSGGPGSTRTIPLLV